MTNSLQTEDCLQRSGSARRLARNITTDLMRMGGPGKQPTAQRLALMQRVSHLRERELGGMCRQCVFQIILEHLLNAALSGAKENL